MLERKATGEVLVEVGGVGYRCLVPLGAMPGSPGGPAPFLFTHLHVREDAMVLYGFPTRDERDTFEVLIGASGVGPKLALAMLSVHIRPRRCGVLAEGDLDALCLVPGVGKRTAQKLMIELKKRLGVPDLDLVDPAADGGPERTGRGPRRVDRARIRPRRGARGAGALPADGHDRRSAPPPSSPG